MQRKRRSSANEETISFFHNYYQPFLFFHKEFKKYLCYSIISEIFRIVGDKMDQQKKLQEKVIDYRNYSTVLMAISTLLYFGVLIKEQEHEIGHMILLVCLTLVFIGLAFLFRYLSLKNEKKLLEMED